MAFLEKQQSSDLTDYQSKFMSQTYGWMSLGLFITAYVSYMTAHSSIMSIIHQEPELFSGLIILQFVMVLGLSFLINRMSGFVAAAMFILYATISGVTFSTLFLVYTQQSIASVFGVTAGMFTGLSIYGTLTKRDLSPFRTLLFGLLIGLVLAMGVNMFMHNSQLSLLTSGLSVIVFSALTAYNTQRFRRMAANGFDNDETATRLSVLAALTLYLDFINIFLSILQLGGGRRR